MLTNLNLEYYNYKNVINITANPYKFSCAQVFCEQV